MKRFIYALVLLTTAVCVHGADKKISDLNSLAEADFAAGDVVPIVDVSASETKKTSISDFDARWVVNPMTTNGDGIYQASGIPARLAIGAANTAQLSTGSAPSWGFIVNANIDAAAGIVDTKLATIATAGKVSNSATTATNANTPSAIVARDGSGNFTAGIVTAALTGNASTATALFADPNDCGGNAFAHTIAANGNLTCSAIPNAATSATELNNPDTIVLRDSSGNFAAGTITANLVGTASGNAHVTLNNLGVTSINADLLPDANGTRNIGSNVLRWNDSFINKIHDASNSTGSASQILTAVGDGTYNWAAAAAAGATTELDNLGTTAINASLFFDADQTYDVGSSTERASAIHTAQVRATDITLLLQGSSVTLVDNTPLRFPDDPNDEYVEVKSPSSLAASYTLTWPPNNGNANQFLTTDGNGVLTWTTPVTSSFANVSLSNLSTTNINQPLVPNADVTHTLGEPGTGWSAVYAPLFSSSDQSTSMSLNGSIGFMADSHVSIQSFSAVAATALRFYDNDNTNYAAIKSPATIGTNYTLTLPVDDGASGEILSTDGSGVLSWIAPSSGANTALSNLTSTSVNQSLNPSSSNSFSLGSASTNRWNTLYVSTIQGGVASQGYTLVNNATNATATSGPALFNPVPGNGTSARMSVFTADNANADAVASGNLYLQTGNKTAGTGNSGDVEIRTGSSTGGLRGDIFLMNGHVVTTGDVPVVSSCGTSPSIVGNDVNGRVTVGTGSPTTCTITFDQVFTNAPNCVVQNEVTAVLLKPAPTTSALVVTGTFTDSDTFSYHCVGYE